VAGKLREVLDQPGPSAAQETEATSGEPRRSTYVTPIVVIRRADRRALTG
jgi:hypothetical protein